MAFVSLILVYLLFILIVIFSSTIVAIILFILSAVLKSNERSKMKSSGIREDGSYNYKIKKTYLIPRIISFIFFIPLILFIALILYAFIATSIEENSSLSYNAVHANTSQVVRIIESDVSPCCTEKTMTLRVTEKNPFYTQGQQKTFV